MKKILFGLVLTSATVAGASAQAWTEKWQWPLVGVNQMYTVGEKVASDPGLGGVGPYWKDNAAKDATAPKAAAADAKPADTTTAAAAPKP